MTDSLPANESAPDRPPLQVTHAPKPKGTAGRKPPRGYNLQRVLHMIRDHYMYMINITYLALSSTKGIVMSKTIELQKPQGLITLVMQKILREADEFEIFRPDGYWPLRAFVYVVLKSSSDKHKRLLKRMAGESGGELGGEPDGEPGEESADPPADGTGGSGDGVTATETKTATTTETETTTTTEIVTASTAVQIQVQVEVGTASDFAIPATTDDAAADELAVGLSSIVLDPTDDAVDAADVSMANADWDGNFLSNDTLAPDSSSLGSTPTPTMNSTGPQLPQLLMLENTLHGVTLLSDAERAALPPTVRLLLASLGIPFATSATSIVSPASAAVPAPGHAPIQAVTSPTAPTQAIASNATLAAALPLAAAIPLATAVAPSASGAPSTTAVKPNLPAEDAPKPADSPITTSTSTKPVPPVMEPFDNDGSLSDAPSATSSNPPILGNIDKPTTRSATRSTTSTATGSGKDVRGRGRGGSRGRGGGTGRGGGKGKNPEEQSKGTSISTDVKGKGRHDAVVDASEADDEPTTVATGARRTRKNN